MNLVKRLTTLACVLVLPGCCVFGFERGKGAFLHRPVELRFVEHSDMCVVGDPQAEQQAHGAEAASLVRRRHPDAGEHADRFAVVVEVLFQDVLAIDQPEAKPDIAG